MSAGPTGRGKRSIPTTKGDGITKAGALGYVTPHDGGKHASAAEGSNPTNARATARGGLADSRRRAATATVNGRHTRDSAAAAGG